MQEAIDAILELVPFLSLCIAAASAYSARKHREKKSAVESANMSFKLDSMASDLKEVNASQKALLEGYTSNEKRITVLEHRVDRLERK